MSVARLGPSDLLAYLVYSVKTDKRGSTVDGDRSAERAVARLRAEAVLLDRRRREDRRHQRPDGARPDPLGPAVRGPARAAPLPDPPRGAPAVPRPRAVDPEVSPPAREGEGPVRRPGRPPR